MERLSLLLPTRGRPELASRFLRSARDRAAQPGSVEAVLYVDDDDVGSQRISCPGIDVVTIVGSRASMGAYNTACLRRSTGEIIILANDDIVIRTDGWDEAIRSLHKSVADEIYLAYPNDLFKGERLAAFPILSRRTCDLIVNPFPAEYKGAFIDYHLLDVFKRLQHSGIDRIVYLGHVVFEHMHYRTGKGALDETYRRRGRFDDDQAFLDLTAERSGAAWLLAEVVTSETSKASVTQDVSALTARGSRQRTSLLRGTLLDFGLPIAWRLRLFFWFIARKVAASFVSTRT